MTQIYSRTNYFFAETREGIQKGKITTAALIGFFKKLGNQAEVDLGFELLRRCKEKEFNTNELWARLYGLRRRIIQRIREEKGVI